MCKQVREKLEYLFRLFFLQDMLLSESMLQLEERGEKMRSGSNVVNYPLLDLTV